MLLAPAGTAGDEQHVRRVARRVATLRRTSTSTFQPETDSLQSGIEEVDRTEQHSRALVDQYTTVEIG